MSQFQEPAVHSTRVRKECWCRVLSSFTPLRSAVVISAQLVDPGIDLLRPSRKRTQDSPIFIEGVGRRACRTNYRAIAFNHEINAISGCKAETIPNLLRNRNLSLAANGAG